MMSQSFCFASSSRGLSPCSSGVATAANRDEWQQASECICSHSAGVAPVIRAAGRSRRWTCGRRRRRRCTKRRATSPRACTCERPAGHDARARVRPWTSGAWNGRALAIDARELRSRPFRAYRGLDFWDPPPPITRVIAGARVSVRPLSTHIQEQPAEASRPQKVPRF